MDRTGIFAGDDPFALARAWLDEAAGTEPSDPNAIALATVDADGMPDARIVLLKEIEDDAFVFYTNYDSAKGRQIAATGRAAFTMHWKTLRRQVRVRGMVERTSAEQADAYYASRPLQSRIGAWASRQSRPLESRDELMARVSAMESAHGQTPDRPPFWGGFRIVPTEIEFWADGTARLHDRFRWARDGDDSWVVTRLFP
ncbi:pyridoxamine 5'-phosphate oxidase [Wenxinia saemankumensis]|uniref:Pyridoxine/pyridoxamine 5'-phosphate oxidase n=1 Tax=Wenxinia saemankumensis TaxID=1447782 RepID=A0A1M6D5Z3_9RHOB|nr:pyridoxamine 5'-phosphate oxidase [Wenxinia saemankumensis]SHI68665.1 Pyridoxamine 5'-phosphate oxidase [Wenxinia saemankumensis]